MGIDDLKKLKSINYWMIVIAFITFLSGFLKGTSMEHSSIVLFFLLFVCGVVLLVRTFQSKAWQITKFFLFVTGISTTLYAILIVLAVVNTIKSATTLSDALEFIEDYFYLTSAAFLGGVIGSLIFLFIQGRPQTHQS